MAKKRNKHKSGKKYDASGSKGESFTKRILSVLRKSPGKPLNYKQIAAKLEVDNAYGREYILKDLAKLAGKGKIDQEGRGKYKLAGNFEYYQGRIEITTHGSGYVIVEELNEDIFIPHKKLNHALDGDIVQVFCFGHSTRAKLEGEITDIIQRKTTKFVGTIHIQKTFGFVVMNSPKMYTDIFVAGEKLNKAKDGEVVEVEMEDWDEKGDSPEGRVIRVLGEPGKHETVIQSILAEKNLAGEFPEEVEEYANSLDTRIHPEEIKKRRDMRSALTFTIDPKDAKDFDDALSFEVLDNGNYQIGIHIADVSYYVKPGTVLDEEAYNRGTSIYLVDRTIPMLPEVLSNKACSLRPNEDKYTFSAIFELDENARVVEQWFGRTVIRSSARFSYAEAQHIIDTQSEEIPAEKSLTGKAYKTDSKIKEAIFKMNELARKMKSQRISDGAISFEKIEVKFQLDENMEPTGVYFETPREANNLIEEFMLLANRKVSEFVSKIKPKKTFVYRCHDEPDDEKLSSLKNLVGRFGYQLNLKDRRNTNQSLNNLLKFVNGRKEQNMVDTLTIRAMSKAYYSTKNIGHYGLSFDYYSHFTSPIRRYPDIMAHRLLQRYLDGKSSADTEEYEVKCKKSSEAEIFAVEAERDSIKYMQVKYMRQYKGKVFLGVISGVTDFGIFVEIVENKCEGMVRLRDIREDQFDFVHDKYAIVGRHTRKKYALGDEVYVKVKAVDVAKRNLDFDLMGSKEDWTRKQPDMREV